MRDYGPTNAQRRLRLILWTKIQTINSLVYPLLSLPWRVSCRFQVAWYKDTMQILPTERLMIETRGAKHSLVIRGVIPTDFGNYSCVASNLLGKERRVVTLTGRPRPVSFQSPSVGQWRDKYNISWTVKSLSPIEEYKLYYKLVSPQHYDLQRSRQPYSSSSSSVSGQARIISRFYYHYHLVFILPLSQSPLAAAAAQRRPADDGRLPTPTDFLQRWNVLEWIDAKRLGQRFLARYPLLHDKEVLHPRHELYDANAGAGLPVRGTRRSQVSGIGTIAGRKKVRN